MAHRPTLTSLFFRYHSLLSTADQNVVEHSDSYRAWYIHVGAPTGQIKESSSLDETPTAIGQHLCGRDILPEPIATEKNIAYVRFKSDASVAHNGFRLEWVVNGMYGCYDI